MRAGIMPLKTPLSDMREHKLRHQPAGPTSGFYIGRTTHSHSIIALSAKRPCRRKAKMSGLSKVKLSVSCPSGSGNGGCRSDGRCADEQTRAEPDRYPGPP